MAHEDHNHHDRDHHDHHKQMARDFRNRFFVSLVLSVPVLAFSPFIQDVLRLPAFSVPYEVWLVMGLATIIFVYGGWPFVSHAYRELREGQPGMMTLVSLAIVVAFGYSAAVFAGVVDGQQLLWELVTLIDVMLLGHWIEMRSVLGASRALEELGALMPDTAHKKNEQGSLVDVAVSELSVEDVVVVKPGEKVPSDGVVLEGASSVNEAMVTGESELVPKEMDDEVIAGSINGNGSLTVRVTKTGADSYLAQIIELVRRAQSQSSRTQNLADTAAAWLTVVAIAAGVATLALWTYVLGADMGYALERTIAVVVIACPHALGLAIPLVVSITTSISARSGILVRDRDVLEHARKLDAVIFDKTGTLTHGSFTVSEVEVVSDEYSEHDVLDFAASVEAHSEHPVANAIAAAGKPRDVRRFEAIPGRGAQAQVYDDAVVVANRAYCEDAGKTIPARADELESSGYTVSFVIINGTLTAVLGLADTVRESSHAAIAELKRRGISVLMITGDNETVAAHTAKELSIDDYRAGVTPDKKAGAVRELKEQYGMVAMVGDGINDAPALSTADVGIAIGAGTDVAIESADLVLVNSDPKDVIRILDISERMYRKMVQNLWWASGYNIVAIPLAAGVLAFAGIVLSPAAGALLMSASTVIVAVNAMLLRRTMALEVV